MPDNNTGKPMAEMNLNVLMRLTEKQIELMKHIPHGHLIKEEHQGSVVAGYGMIEETLEYLNSIGFKAWRPNPLSHEERLEEITDILFFFVELKEFSGFTWEQILTQYEKKWEENMERYRKSLVGDYSWDKRGKTGGL